ncbi:MAG: ABC transporter permease [Synergistaceae bacterium]|jgi:NitT/TauT family transport system permease protein|nr:ABC transporter permease [Synergistaceae bacterium]
MNRVLSSLHRRLASVYLLIVFFALWQIVPSAGFVNATYLTPLFRVIREIPIVGYFNLATDVLISLKRVAIGFLISTAAALPLGFVLAGALPKLAKFLNPLLLFLSQIPPFILFPVFVIIFGVGESGIVTVIIWSAVWPILFNTISGINMVDPLLVKCARSMCADKLTIFLEVVLPSSLPSIMTGMRSGLTLCFLMLIGAETMGANSGMGWEINMAQRMAVIPRIYLMALIVAVVGLAINYLFEWIERTLITWKEAERDALA